jgi:hypothetical protein
MFSVGRLSYVMWELNAQTLSASRALEQSLWEPRRSRYPRRNNDTKRTRNLDYVMGDANDLINAAKNKFSASRAVLCCVLRRKRRFMGAHWSNKRQTRVGSKYTRSDFCKPKLLDGRLEL